MEEGIDECSLLGLFDLEGAKDGVLDGSKLNEGLILGFMLGAADKEGRNDISLLGGTDGLELGSPLGMSDGVVD